MLLLVDGAYQPFAEPPDIQHNAFDVNRSGLAINSELNPLVIMNPKPLKKLSLNIII